ncbi:MAG: glycine zipper family protein [Porticoccaceae bacterium]|nr:glycine zipper family protein [Porticoccaceae bacterium]
MKLLVPLVCCLFLVACANTYRGYGYSGVIIDEKGVDMAAFHGDLADCEGYAGYVNKGERVVGRAAEGAVVGGVLGAVFDGSDGAAKGAGTGAVLSGVRGARSAEWEKKRVVRNCLHNRGYRVLN